MNVFISLSRLFPKTPVETSLSTLYMGSQSPWWQFLFFCLWLFWYSPGIPGPVGTNMLVHLAKCHSVLLFITPWEIHLLLNLHTIYSIDLWSPREPFFNAPGHLCFLQVRQLHLQNPTGISEPAPTAHLPRPSSFLDSPSGVQNWISSECL